MTKRTILLIQSTQTQGNGTKRHLEDSGYRVIWTSSGLTALRAAGNEPVDLILLDVALPDIEGAELCHRFRVRQDTRSIPIVLLASRGYLPDRQAAGPYGPDGYLAKPYTESELDDLVTAMLLGKPSAAEKAKKTTEPVSRHAQSAETPQKMQRDDEQTKPPSPQEPRPALITVASQARKPDRDLQSAAALKREPSKAAEGKPAQRPELRLVPKQRPISSEPEKQALAAPTRENPGTGPAPNEKVAQGSNAGQSPLLPFTGTGDDVVDPATGLFGRPQFEAMFSKEFKRAVRFKQQMSCMLINLDGRRMGRRAGEALVKSIIGLVQKTIREVDTAAWWSGEALIVLLPNTMRRDALQAAARILEAVANHPLTMPDATNVTVSIGVSGLPNRRLDTEQKMIEAADAMCRRAQEVMVPPPYDVRSIKKR